MKSAITEHHARFEDISFSGGMTWWKSISKTTDKMKRSLS